MVEERVDERLYVTICEVARELGVTVPRAPADPTLGETMRLLDRVTAEADSDAPVGLLVGQRLPLLALGGLGLAIRSSSSVRAAYERLARFHKVRARFVDVSMDPEPDDRVRVSLRYRLPALRCLPAIYEGGIALMIRLGRLVTDTSWDPVEIAFPHPIRHQAQWREFVDAQIVTAESTSLVLHRDHLGMLGASDDPLLTDYLDRAAEQQLEDIRPPMTTRVQAWIGPLLDRAPTAEACARALALSRRTLHRRLVQEGTTFAAELERARRSRAETMLHDGAAVGEVALALGYADTSSFCRAYKRWTGRSPRGLSDSG